MPGMEEAGVGSSTPTDAVPPQMADGKEKEEKGNEARINGAILGSDPLGPEEKRLAEGAKDKRPEEREEGEISGEEDEDEEFDYLAYAQQRALFFWGDVLQLGLVSLEELPVEIRGRVKRVEY